MTTTVRTIRPNWCFIRLNERVEHWNLPDAIRPYLAAIYGIYAFDRNLHTHCCELAPSYYLHAIDWDWEYSPLLNTMPEPAWQRAVEVVCDEFQSVSLDNSSHYRHVKNVEALINHTDTKLHQAGDLDPEDEHGDDQYGMLAEYWNPNPRF